MKAMTQEYCLPIIAFINICALSVVISESGKQSKTGNQYCVLQVSAYFVH